MSLNTQFRSWTVQGNFGGSVTWGGSVGLFNYRLTASQPVPGTEPHGHPFTVAAPSMARGNIRQRVPGSPSTEVTPHTPIISGTTSPTLRTTFGLFFGGAGGGPGIPVGGTFSTPRDPSTSCRLAFFGPSRSANDLRSTGAVVEGGITLPYSSTTAGVQILLINFPTELMGGTIAFARNLQSALAGRSWNVPDIFGFFGSFATPDSSIAVIGGLGRGVAAGLTVYGGGFRVE
ncbi:MAG: hypothetical protein AB2L11_01015 [Syntrophobacteraceae bacterium]